MNGPGAHGPGGRGRPVPRGRTQDLALWKQALTGIGLVTLGALLAVGVGLLMAAVLSWLF